LAGAQSFNVGSLGVVTLVGNPLVPGDEAKLIAGEASLSSEAAATANCCKSTRRCDRIGSFIHRPRGSIGVPSSFRHLDLRLKTTLRAISIGAMSGSIELHETVNGQTVPAGTVFVWILRLPSLCLDRHTWDTLSSSEQAKANRFSRDVDRTRYVLNRASLRRILGRCCGCDPSSILFDYGSEGKPRLSSEIAADIEFNLSHSHEYCVIALARRLQIGIDIERIVPVGNLTELVRKIAHPDEQSALELFERRHKLKAFFRLWTRKESVLKAYSTGFSTDPRSIICGFDTEKSCDVSSRNGETSSCQILNLDSPTGYCAALATRSTLDVAVVLQDSTALHRR
jgi:4'-phosphopantetheinyl transferase